MSIIGIQFGIANPAEILARSVVEVTTDKLHQGGQPVQGGVFDSRFGVIENGKTCPTCQQTNLLCPGHFGSIQLARPVYLYHFLDHIMKILQVVCINCSQIYLTEADMEIIKQQNYEGLYLFKLIRDKIVTQKTKEIKLCPHCSTPAMKKITKREGSVARLQAVYYNMDKEAEPVELQPEMVLRCFQRITNENVDRLGFSSKFSRPDWMICTVLAVPPLTVRPSIVMEDGVRTEDDLTRKLIDIVRNNSILRDKIDKGESAQIISSYTDVLQFDVATYIDNDIKGLPPSIQRSGRPLKTLKSRFGSKTGIVRGNLMGKRVDYSARSVITPDPNIELDELGVPEEIARNLTKPEQVTPYNRDRLMTAVQNGQTYPGAKSVYQHEEKKTVRLKFMAGTIDLRIGDIVHRHLVDGDCVLFNRQPSLHKASMECHRVRVLPYSTFRLNVSVTKPYNADFDGDEMNMHVPQSIVAETELKYLATVLRQIISPRTNSPIIQVFQDTMTGLYRLSQPEVTIPEHLAMNILARSNKPYKRQNKNCSGQDLIAAIYPIMNVKSGVIDSKVIGGQLHAVYNDFGPQRCAQMINDIQNIVTKFNMYSGFSVGPSDVVANTETTEFISDTLAKTKNEIVSILSNLHSGLFLNTSSRNNGEELEKSIMSKVNEIDKLITNQITNALSKENRMVQMVTSGAKGKSINIAQIMGMLNQQLVGGKRLQYTLQNRTLPHFAKFDDGLESRGFVENSFISGLRPHEFFFHAMGGREGLIDTAVKTSDSGYISRKLIKTMEDLHVEYDGTVRDVNRNIIQFKYGGDGMDTTSIEKQECKLGVMTMEEVYSNFAGSIADFGAVVDLGEASAPDMIEQILEDREYLVKNVLLYKNNDTVFAPINLRRLLKNYENNYAVKTNLTPQYVVDKLDEFTSQTSKLFGILMRYYLAIIVLRLTQSMFDDIMKEIKFKYIKSGVHAGEMVGALAAQSIGEPTTQLTLNTFHSAGTVNANATQGVPRIEELLSVTYKPKNPTNTIYFKPDIAVSEDQIMQMVYQIQKTTLRDITDNLTIYYDPNPNETTVQDDRELLQTFQKFSVSQLCVSPWILRLEFNKLEMATRHVTDMTLITTRIMANKTLKVFECIHSDINSGKLIMRLTFNPDVAKNMLSLRYIEEKLLDTVLTGVPNIGRVFRREVKNELVYNEKIGGYVSAKQFVLDIEGANILDISTFSNTDPYQTFSDSIHEILEVFGIETARLTMITEFKRVFGDTYVNYHHLMILVDAMTYPGKILSVNRFGMKKNESGVLAKSSFEETTKVLFDAAITGDFDNMRGVSANIMFGQKPPCGTGFVNVLIDETRLPEGVVDIEVPPEITMPVADTQCRMEDIMMEW